MPTLGEELLLGAASYVDFFLLSRADVVLRTHMSYFGKVAALVGGKPYFTVSKSSCTINGTKHTPQRCAVPMQPPWCLSDNGDLH